MLDLRTVYECNRCLGCKTLHPQVGIINLENPSLEEDAVKFEFYAVLLIEDCPGDCCCYHTGLSLHRREQLLSK